MAPVKGDAKGKLNSSEECGSGNNPPNEWPKILENPDFPCREKVPVRRLLLENQMQVLLISTDGSPCYSSWAQKFPLFSFASRWSGKFPVDRLCHSPEHSMYCSRPLGCFSNMDGDSVVQQCNFAIAVNSGSSSDPDNALGMAHFIEHLVHYGSLNYPQYDSLIEFLSSNEGDYNAWTDREKTCYFAYLNNVNALRLGLIRYADLLFHPKLDNELIQREVLSIENELHFCRCFNVNRICQLIHTLGIPGDHPLKKFMCGSIATLFPTNRKVQELRKEILKFHQAHYRPENMALVVQAPASLDLLQKFVMDTFGAIQPTCSNLISKQISLELFNPYLVESFNRLITIKPGNSDVHTVKLFFALPPEAWKDYKRKPLNYIAMSLTNKRPGGLCQLLLSRGWIMSMDAGATPSGSLCNQYATLFTISILLSQKGRDELSVVLEAVFAYIRFLTMEGIQKSVFQNLKSTAELWFRSFPLGKSVDDSCDLAQRLLLPNYEMKHLITGSTLYFEYNPDIIKMYLDELKPEKACYVLVTADTGNSEYLTERWFDAKYIVQKLDTAMLIKFQTGTQFSGKFRNQPSNYHVDYDRLSEVEKTGSLPVARIIKASDQNFMIFQPTRPITTPQSMFEILIYSNLNSKIAHSKAPAFDVYCLMWTLKSEKNFSYVQQSELGTSVILDFSPSQVFLYVQVIGFSIIAKDALKNIMDAFFDQNWDPKEEEMLFNTSKEFMLHMYYEKANQHPLYAADLFNRIKRINHLSALESYDELKQLSFQDLKNIVKHFKSSLCIEALATGAVTEAQAEDVVQYFERKEWPRMDIRDMEEIYKSRSTEVKIIPLGERCLRIKSLLPKEKPFVLLNYYQMGYPTTEATKIASIISELFKDYVHLELRNKEQLGYIVGSVMFSDIRNGVGVYVMANSDRHSICHIDNRIDNCVQKFVEKKLTRKFLLNRLKVNKVMRDPSYVQEYARKYLIDKGTTNNKTGYRKVSVQVCHENIHMKCVGNCCHQSKWLKPLFHIGKESAEVCVAGPSKPPLRNKEVYFIETTEAFHKYPGK